MSLRWGLGGTLSRAADCRMPAWPQGPSLAAVLVPTWLQGPSLVLLLPSSFVVLTNRQAWLSSDFPQKVVKKLQENEGASTDPRKGVFAVSITAECCESGVILSSGCYGETPGSERLNQPLLIISHAVQTGKCKELAASASAEVTLLNLQMIILSLILLKEERRTKYLRSYKSAIPSRGSTLVT